MLKAAVTTVFFGLALMFNCGQALAEEFCLKTSANNRFHLEMTTQTTTSQGTVTSLVGIRVSGQDGDLRGPVTGTLFVEPDTSPTSVRVNILDMNSVDGGASVIYTMHMTAVSDPLGTSFTGTSGVWRQGAPVAMGSSAVSLVDCQTGDLIHF